MCYFAVFLHIVLAGVVLGTTGGRANEAPVGVTRIPVVLRTRYRSPSGLLAPTAGVGKFVWCPVFNETTIVSGY